MEVINNKDLEENQKKKAVTSMTELTKTTDMENTVETLLKAKGFRGCACNNYRQTGGCYCK